MALSDEFLSIDTPENVIFEYEVVGIGTRFVAALIDTSLLVMTILLVNLLTVLLLDDLLSGLRGWLSALVTALSFLIIWGYYIFFELRWNGQSPGKRWAHIRVIRRDGLPITLSESLVRNLVRIVDFLPFAYGIGLISMFVNDQACRLGDLAAGTLVVREQEEAMLLSDIGPRPLPSRTLSTSTLVESKAEQSEPWPLELLSTEDLQLVEDFLRRRHTLSNQSVLAQAIVKRLLRKLGLADEPMSAAQAIYILTDIAKAARQ